MPKLQPMAQPPGGRGRRRRGARVSTTLSEINVVPLVDVMLVLLIIFMVAAPMMTQGLDVNLPVSRQSPVITKERVFVTVPLAYRETRQVQIGDEFIRVDVLDERMRQAMLNIDDKEVYVRADGDVMYRELVEVMDKLKDGGIERVGLLTRPPDR
jgi:biopolymer transport protein TolR